MVTIKNRSRRKMAISEENIEHVESTGKNELGLDSNRTKNHDISTR